MIRDSRSSSFCIRKAAALLRKKANPIAGPLFRDMTLGAIGGGMIGGIAPANGRDEAAINQNRGLHALVGSGIGATAGALANLIDYQRMKKKNDPLHFNFGNSKVDLDPKSIENMSEQELAEALRQVAEQAPDTTKQESLV